MKNVSKAIKLAHKYNSLPRIPHKRLFLEPLQRAGKQLEKIENLVFVFGSSGLKVMAYSPILLTLPKPTLAIGSSGGCLAAFSVMSGISPSEFENAMEVEKNLRYARIRMIFRMIMNKFQEDHPLLRNLEALCIENDIRNCKQVPNFFGVSSIGGDHRTVLFGHSNGLSINTELPIWKLIYSSFAYPVAFPPVGFDEIEVFDKHSEIVETVKDVEVYDGPSGSKIPLDEATYIARKNSLNNTLFVLFNFLTNRKRFSASPRKILEDLINGYIKETALYSIEQNEVPLLLVNINYGGDLSGIQIDDVDKLERIKVIGARIAEKTAKFFE